MSKKSVQLIVMVFIAIMFIATVVITIVFKPTHQNTNTASSATAYLLTESGSDITVKIDS